MLVSRHDGNNRSAPAILAARIDRLGDGLEEHGRAHNTLEPAPADLGRDVEQPIMELELGRFFNKETGVKRRERHNTSALPRGNSATCQIDGRSLTKTLTRVVAA